MSHRGGVRATKYIIYGKSVVVPGSEGTYRYRTIDIDINI